MIDQQQYPDQEPQAQPWADEPSSPQEPLGEEEEADRNLLEWVENDLWGLPVLRNNRGFILFCLFLGAIAIAWPYFYQGSLREITSLEEKLKDIRYKSLYTSAALIEYEQGQSVPAPAGARYPASLSPRRLRTVPSGSSALNPLCSLFPSELS